MQVTASSLLGLEKEAGAVVEGEVRRGEGVGEAIPKTSRLLFGLCPNESGFPLRGMGEDGERIDPCESAKFNMIKYFLTQDFGLNKQSSIFRDKNLTFLNN